MILPLREIDIVGVFVAPAALCFPVAAAATWLVMSALRLTAPWRATAAIELAVFVGLTSSLLLLLGRI